MAKVKFKASGCCSAVGNFAPGDLAVVGDAMAAHLVEIGAAELVAPPLSSQFVDTIPVPPPEPPDAIEIVHDPIPAKRRGKG